jgi:hypothetical protein
LAAEAKQKAKGSNATPAVALVATLVSAAAPQRSSAIRNGSKLHLKRKLRFTESAAPITFQGQGG